MMAVVEMVFCDTLRGTQASNQEQHQYSLDSEWCERIKTKSSAIRRTSLVDCDELLTIIKKVKDELKKLMFWRNGESNAGPLLC